MKHVLPRLLKPHNPARELSRTLTLTFESDTPSRKLLLEYELTEVTSFLLDKFSPNILKFYINNILLNAAQLYYVHYAIHSGIYYCKLCATAAVIFVKFLRQICTYLRNSFTNRSFGSWWKTSINITNASLNGIHSFKQWIDNNQQITSKPLLSEMKFVIT